MPSYYEALPIYKVAMDVAVRVDAVVQRFAKGHKYTLGFRRTEVLWQRQAASTRLSFRTM